MDELYYDPEEVHDGEFEADEVYEAVYPRAIAVDDETMGYINDICERENLIPPVAVRIALRRYWSHG